MRRILLLVTLEISVGDVMVANASSANGSKPHIGNKISIRPGRFILTLVAVKAEQILDDNSYLRANSKNWIELFCAPSYVLKLIKHLAFELLL